MNVQDNLLHINIVVPHRVIIIIRLLDPLITLYNLVLVLYCEKYNQRESDFIDKGLSLVQKPIQEN